MCRLLTDTFSRQQWLKLVKQVLKPLLLFRKLFKEDKEDHMNIFDWVSHLLPILLEVGQKHARIYLWKFSGDHIAGILHEAYKNLLQYFLAAQQMYFSCPNWTLAQGLPLPGGLFTCNIWVNFHICLNIHFLQCRHDASTQVFSHTISIIYQ